MAPGMARSLVGRRGRPGARVLDPSAFAARIGGEEGRWLAANVPDFDCPDAGFRAIYDFRWRVFKRAHPADTRRLRRHRVPPRRPVGGQAQHDQLRRWTPFPRGAVDPRPAGTSTTTRASGSARGASPGGTASGPPTRSTPATSPRATRPRRSRCLPDLVANYEAWEKTTATPTACSGRSTIATAWSIRSAGAGIGRRSTLICTATPWRSPRSPDLAGRTHARRVVPPQGGGATATSWRSGSGTTRRGSTRWSRAASGPRRSTCARRSASSPGTSTCRDAGREVAWQQLTDPNGFAAPFGPTTAERRHPRFNERHNHECLWNGPSWPFATTQTLVALANLLNHDGPNVPARQEGLLRRCSCPMRGRSTSSGPTARSSPGSTRTSTRTPAAGSRADRPA